MRARSLTAVLLSVPLALLVGLASGEEVVITDQIAQLPTQISQARPAPARDDDLFDTRSSPAIPLEKPPSPSLLGPGMRIPQPQSSPRTLLDPFGTGRGVATPRQRDTGRSDLFLGPDTDDVTPPFEGTPTEIPGGRTPRPIIPRDVRPSVPTPAIPSSPSQESVEHGPEFLRAPIEGEIQSPPGSQDATPPPRPSSGDSGMPYYHDYDAPIYGETVSDGVFLDGSMVMPAGCDACGAVGCGGLCGAPPRGQWFVKSWLAQGFTWNPEDPRNGSNLPVTFNDFANDYQMNQLYVSLGREIVNYGMNWDVGGRIDLLYGTDYFFTTATGLETHGDGSPKWNSEDGRRAAPGADYGLAMPQLYLEMYAPLGPGVTVKAGHFYTTLGFESVMAPENFFYSHAYTMQYGEPFTHTGILFDFPLSRNLRMNAGVTRGWDNFDDNNDEAGFLGGFAWTSDDCNTTFDFAITSGHEDDAAELGRVVYSMVFTRKLSSNVSYIAQSDFGSESQAQTTPTGRDSAKWYGLNQYLLYDVSSTVSTGVRFEWFRDQDNARVLALPIESLVDGGNYYQLTFGLNWKPRSFMLFRPELRWDWSDVSAPGLGRDGMFNDFTDKNQLTIAGDLILRF